MLDLLSQMEKAKVPKLIGNGSKDPPFYGPPRSAFIGSYANLTGFTVLLHNLHEQP